MRFYPITDTELDNLSNITTIFNVLLAAGAFLMGLGITALLSLLTISPEVSPKAWGANAAIGVLSLIGAAAICAVLWSIYQRRDNILSRCKNTPRPTKPFDTTIA